MGERCPGGSTVSRVKDKKELLFQGISGQQTTAGIEHKVNLLFLLWSKEFVSLVQQDARVFKVNPSGFTELFLFFFSNGLEGPEYLAYVVIFVDDIYGIFEISMRDVRVSTSHVTDKMFCLGAVKFTEIFC
jgi:hypothetical protein